MNTKTILSIIGITLANITSTTTYAIGTNSENKGADITLVTATTKQWQAGRIVSMAEIKKNGLEHYFCKRNINNPIFARIYGKSYKTNCTLPRTELRYLQLLHYTVDGRIMTGEMICHKDIANDLIEIFRKLYDAHYPIERMQLIDDFGADDVTSMNNNTHIVLQLQSCSRLKETVKAQYGQSSRHKSTLQPLRKAPPQWKDNCQPRERTPICQPKQTIRIQD